MMHIVLETPMVEYSNVARIWPTAKQFPLPLLGNHFAPCHIFHSYLALRTSLELDSYYTRAVLWELKVNHLQTWAAHLSRLSCKSRWCKALLFATLKNDASNCRCKVNLRWDKTHLSINKYWPLHCYRPSFNLTSFSKHVSEISRPYRLERTS